MEFEDMLKHPYYRVLDGLVDMYQNIDDMEVEISRAKDHAERVATRFSRTGRSFGSGAVSRHFGRSVSVWSTRRQATVEEGAGRDRPGSGAKGSYGSLHRK